METVFSTPAAQTGAFYTLLMVWAVAAGAAAVLVPLILRGSPHRVAFRHAFIGALLAYPCIAALLYFTTVARFAAFSLGPEGVVLAFGAPHAARVELARADIGDVLFGMAGKHASAGCYIKFVTRSGTSYRSEALHQPLEACKAVRREALAQLAK